MSEAELAGLLPEGQYTDIGDGLQIHHHESGPTDGSPVVFFHGSGPGASGYSNFKDCIANLGDQGFRALAPDTLGYGRSSKPTDRGYQVDHLVDCAVAFLDAQGLDKVSLVGNSMGGAMAIRLAARFPDRVEKLVLMAPGGLEDTDTYMKMRGIRAMIGSLYGPEGLTRAGMEKVFGLQLFDPAALGERLDRIIDARFAVAQTQPLHVFKTLRVPDCRPDLAGLQMPILALWGVEDQFCPVSGAMTLAKSCPDIQVNLLSGCGHWVMVERAKQFNQWCLAFVDDR